MLATLVDAPFHRPGWVWEEKYDGIRLIARKHGRRVELLTRNDKDRTDDFPDVAAAVAALPAATLVLDGEVVVFDAGGVSRFQLLQRRGAGASSPVYVVFDCLHARGRDLTRRAAHRSSRRARARGGARGRRSGSPGAWPPTVCEAFAEARTAGTRRRHRQGPRAGYRARRALLGVVQGEGAGGRGVRDRRLHGAARRPPAPRRAARRRLGRRRLRYAGKVGTGFTDATLADLHRR